MDSSSIRDIFGSGGVGRSGNEGRLLLPVKKGNVAVGETIKMYIKSLLPKPPKHAKEGGRRTRRCSFKEQGFKQILRAQESSFNSHLS